MKQKAQGLYDPRYEHDACGVGFVAHIKNTKSHDIVARGLNILCNLEHRGAVGADPLAGDGAGILIQVPDRLFRAEAARLGFALPPVGDYAVGMMFLPQDVDARRVCEETLEQFTRAEGQTVLGWRDVPVQISALGESIKPNVPVIRQIFIGKGANVVDTDAFERKLFVIRKQTHTDVRAKRVDQSGTFYIASLSTRTIVYKGMVIAARLSPFFDDLRDERLESAIALVHQRFSTNTFPSWELAHPFRFLAHNGEINTLRGNINWMMARRHSMTSKVLGDDLAKLWPLIGDGNSDSATLDNCLELLLAGGYSLPHALMMMIPEAWSGNKTMFDDRRAFYEYHAALMEPWDGPAAIAFTDGRHIGATLDRNGLRPARFIVTHDDLIVMSSEAGVLEFPEEQIKQKWRLEPGRMLLVDLAEGKIIGDGTLKAKIANARPYQAWLDETQIRLESLPEEVAPMPPSKDVLLDAQQAFGYTQEDIKVFLKPMGLSGEDALGSMGRDTPLAVLSQRPKMLFDYFQQRFAQVTNPPIDSIREELVMSLVSLVGPRPNLFDLDSGGKHIRLELKQPILSNMDLEKIRRIEDNSKGAFRAYSLSICWPVEEGAAGMADAIERICKTAEKAVTDGHNIIILTDRPMDADHIAVPSLLATAAVHHHLIRSGQRTEVGLVVETGEARQLHDFCLLAGYGAEAINPYVALDTLSVLRRDMAEQISEYEIHKRYIKAVSKGIMKVMSKMGICTFQSYCGAQIFDAVGLSSAFLDRYFTGTASPIEGADLDDIAEETVRRHTQAYGDAPNYRNALDVGGELAYRVSGETHVWTSEVVSLLQHAVRGNDYNMFRQYSKKVGEQGDGLISLRGLLDFNFAETPLPLEEVESAASIAKRFASGAMSFGSISWEAHTTLAIALNRLGGKSNTGEGGEDPQRYKPLENGDTMRSAIKQVASGRFGVNAEYLVNSDDIQIKMAQGAKPGEGGQLPGHKVDDWIARTRHSVAGVGLISPPPHHDIYSIEDLKQLIHDLKNVNPRARVSVKLVSELGVGTIAAGVAKAKADHVTIAGWEGGTGASPVTSIQHAGEPWEIGLAETHQTLVINGLRSRIAVQVDGGIRSGREVVIGALLGADEFGFATAALIAAGCIMMRKCHLNTCPVGVATQNPELRHRFVGKPEDVTNFFLFIAEEVRADVKARLPQLPGDDRPDRPAEAAPGQRPEGARHRPVAGALQARESVRRHALSERDAGSRAGRGLGPGTGQTRPERDRASAARDHRPADHQREPHSRRPAVGRDRQALWRRGPAGRLHPCEFQRHCRPELWRLFGPRCDFGVGGPGQRLCRQGPLGRSPDHLSEEPEPARPHQERDRRQYRPLRRHRGRVLFQRRRRRALRRAQLRRRGRGRGRRRPWLRIHDRRLRRGAGHHRQQLRCRHERRRRLCTGRGRHLRRSLQPGDGRAGADRGTGCGAGSAGKSRRRPGGPWPCRRHAQYDGGRCPPPAHADRAPCEVHRQPAWQGDPGRLGQLPDKVRESDAHRISPRADRAASVPPAHLGRSLIRG